MIHIKYKLKNSKLHGVGVFAAEVLKKGQLIYTPNPALDVDITEAQFLKLKPEERKEVEYYGYFNNKSNRWHVAFDVIRFLNHGDEKSANVIQDENMVLRSTRDIDKGEELLQNYNEIYPKTFNHFKRINNSK